MGLSYCSCFNTKEPGQVVFDPDALDDNQNLASRPTINTPFELISNYYASKNIQVIQISPQEFSNILNSEPQTESILKEYEEKFDEIQASMNCNINIGPIKFINKDSTEFYYDGEFNREGEINGKGTKIMKDKSVYRGWFLNGEYNGKGLLIKNGASIFGDWVEGECNGQVIYKLDNEFEYKGNFEKNKKNGYGIEKYNNGSVYEGNFLNNKKSGYGIYKFQNGEIYEGNFENDLYNGKGKYTWGISGRNYEGEFKNGIIEGKGKYTYEDGTIFNGNFINGEKNGEGYIEFPNGKKYYGNWLNDELYGNGCLVDGNEKIDIVFRHGKIIRANTHDDSHDTNNENNNFENIKFNEECFVGNKNGINIDKYICTLCKCFFVQPLKCLGCNSNFCEKCIDKNCNTCNNDKFEINNELIKEMMEYIKIKCYKCEQILDYQSSLNHFH